MEKWMEIALITGLVLAIACSVMLAGCTASESAAEDGSPLAAAGTGRQNTINNGGAGMQPPQNP
ncbi:MAG: hypothetical protein WCY41_03820 [Candidatus Micrarchaeia archaeon]